MSRLCVLVLVFGCGGGGHKSDDANTQTDGLPAGDGTQVDADPACANPGSIPALSAVQVVAGLTQPVFLAQPPGSSDLYVVEKTGRIKIVRNGSALATPFLDVSTEVQIPNAQAEGGLLGLAFKADYTTSGRFFVYADVKPSNGKLARVVVREYKRSTTNADVAGPAVRDLIDSPQDGYNSVGGTIAFGPDGKLWIGLGDAAAMPSDAPVLTSRRGKMLRIDVDNPTVAPSDNLGGGADPYVWDYGLRNPYRFSFDRLTGDVYIADAGDTLYEEVNIEAPGMGHKDYGWDRVEGKHCKNGTTSCGSQGTLPQYERAHETGYSVIIGGYVYRGSALPCLRGRYLFTIYGVAKVMSFVWNGQAVTSETELTNMFSQNLIDLVGFGEDNAGELYMLTFDGHIYKIVAG